MTTWMVKVLKLWAGLRTGGSPEERREAVNCKLMTVAVRLCLGVCGGKCTLCLWFELIKSVPKSWKWISVCHSLNVTYLTGRGTRIAPLLSSNLLRHHLGDDKSSANTQDSSSCFIGACAVEGCGAGSGDRPTGRGWYRHFNLSVSLVHLPVRETLSRQPLSDSGKGQCPLAINNQPVKLSLPSWEADNLGRGSLWETVRDTLCPWIRSLKAYWGFKSYSSPAPCYHCCWWWLFQQSGGN